MLDGVVNAAGKLSVITGRFIYRYIDQGVVDGTVNASGRGASESGQFLRKIQTGQVREYAALMFGAAVLLVTVFIFAA